MTTYELHEIAIRMVEKGYTNDDIRYCDDLYSATPEEIEECLELADMVVTMGTLWARNNLGERG